MKGLDGFFAVVPLFNPSPGDCDFANNLSLIFKYVIVVDNSCVKNDYFMDFNNIKNDNVIYIFNGGNLGYAKAVNIAARRAFCNGALAIITFDQDSRVASNFSDVFDKYISIVDLNRCILGFRGANNIDENDFFLFRKVTTVISSGMVVGKHVYQMLGGFEEKYFIDSVDHEYCLRARSLGVEIYKIKTSGIVHTIGGNVGSLIPIHGSDRKYYIFRNVTDLIGRYWRREVFWSLKQVLRLFVELFSVVLFESNKKNKLRAIFYGVRDSYMKVFGPRCRNP